MFNPRFTNHQIIWICGGRGRVGSALTRLLNPLDYHIFSTDIDEVDITDLAAVRLFGERNYPHFIINCVGYSNVARCEANPDEAYRVNAIGARNLAMTAQEVDATLIQFSTDDVFDGLSEVPVNEFHATSPRSVYGQTKRAAEEFVRDLTNKHYIVRSTWLYGKSHLKHWVNTAKRDGEVRVGANYFGAPTSSLALSRFIIAMMSGMGYGTYHASCRGVVSRKEYVETVLANARVDAKVIEEEPHLTLSHGRPPYAVLDNMMMRLTSNYEMPTWQDALREFMTGRF